MDVQVNTDQIKILQDFFNGLSSIDQRKIFIASFRRAVKPLVERAKADAPYRTGTLMRSFGTMEMPENISILVGAKLSGVNKGWYGHLVEKGTIERFRRKRKNAPTGRVRGTHFFENAYNSVQEKMYDDMAQAWYDEIDRFIIKTNKRA